MTLQPPRWQRALEVAANASLLLVTMYVAWMVLRPASRPAGPKLPTSPLSLAGTQHVGRTSATVALVLFSDFECPFCRRFAQSVLPSLMKKYVEPGKVVIGFRHFPNEAGHPLAMGASKAAYCAGKQGKFWRMHDSLFEGLGPFEAIRSRVAELGLDEVAFDACVARDADSPIREDVRLARSLGLRGTPTSLVGSLSTVGSGKDLAVKVVTLITGSPPVETFEKVLDRLLERSAAGIQKPRD